MGVAACSEEGLSGVRPARVNTRGTGGRGQPGAGTHHDADAAAQPASPRAAAAPHDRNGSAASALYRGRHRRCEAGGPARGASVRLHKLPCIAHICVHLSRCGCAARQHAGRTRGTALGGSIPVPRLLPASQRPRESPGHLDAWAGGV